MDSYNFLPDNEVTEVEGRKYLNPNLVVDETNTFIDRLRNTQQANMQQTATQTQRLGTDVPSNLGGLTGAGSYWSSRYVTPQTNSAVSNLRAAAQAQALNQALANEEAMWKKKYNDAYRAYQKSAYDKSNAGDGNEGGVDYIDTTNPVDIEVGFTPSTSYPSVMAPDGNGGTTGVEVVVLPDGSNKIIDHRVNYSEDNMERAAGADQLSDIFTGMYNYSLPGGFEVELGGWDENLRKDSDGNYYVWNKSKNKYTPIVVYDQNTGSYYSANGKPSGKTTGGTKWWKK